MNINQSLVDRIVARAQNSACSLGKSDKRDPYNISVYANPELHSLAILLVSAHHDKWDIISIFTAALEVVAEEAKNETRTPDEPEATYPHFRVTPLDSSPIVP